MASQEEALRAAIEERVREQGGRLVGWALGASIARRVLATVNAELDKISPDGSELRAAFDEWVRREITRMEEDPARAAEVGAAIRRVVAHETVQAWLWDVWSRLRVALEADAARPSGRTVAVLEARWPISARCWRPTRRRGPRAAGVEARWSSLLPAAQTRLADFIAQVVGGWDAKTITDTAGAAGRQGPAIRAGHGRRGIPVGGLLYLAPRAGLGMADSDAGVPGSAFRLTWKARSIPGCT